MYTTDWGPYYWVLIHIVTYYNSNKQYQLEFFKALADFIPCNFCNKHYKKNIENIDEQWKDFDKQQDVIDWAIDLHTKVSKSVDENYVQPDKTTLNNLYKYTFQHEGAIFLALDIIVKYGLFIKKEKELVNFIKLFYNLFPVQEKKSIVSSIAVKNNKTGEFYINSNWTNIKYFKELFTIAFYKLDFIIKFLPIQEEILENIEVQEGQDNDVYTADNYETASIHYKYIVPHSKKVVLKLKGNCNKEIKTQITIGELKSSFNACELENTFSVEKIYNIYPELNTNIFEVKLTFIKKENDTTDELKLNIDEFHLELV